VHGVGFSASTTVPAASQWPLGSSPSFKGDRVYQQGGQGLSAEPTGPGGEGRPSGRVAAVGGSTVGFPDRGYRDS